ncbi:MAG: glycosyltransferase [Lachnospiraceae bacterium]|nr:glycosyltransferase [Lachnospiraceae bacterium]
MNKVSVVISTYNGEKYIEEQLESVLKQTMQPDEVIISDDASNDQTVLIVEDFIKKNKLENWVIIKNRENKGWMKNFFDLLCKASGDIVFMCDQDDVWIQDKIEVMFNNMIAQPDILCLSGKYISMDDKGNIFQKTDEISHNFIEKVKYSKKFFQKSYLGCTLAVSRKLLETYRALEWDFWGHDAICSHMALMMDGMYILNKPVIYHRYHGNNVTTKHVDGNYGNSTLEKRISWVEEEINYFENLKQALFVKPFSVPDIELHLRCLRGRRKFLVNRKVFDCFKIVRFLPRTLTMHVYMSDIAYTYGIHKQLGEVLKILNNLKAKLKNILKKK